jgi:hypothetical protein
VNVKEPFVSTPDGKRHTRSQKYTPSSKYPTMLEAYPNPKKREIKEMVKKNEVEVKIET